MLTNISIVQFGYACTSDRRGYHKYQNFSRKDNLPSVLQLSYDFVLRLLLHNLLAVIQEHLLQWRGDGLHSRVREIVGHAVLAVPVVADKYPFAQRTRVAVRLGARNFLQIVLVVIAHELAERTLLVEQRVLPLRAVIIPNVVRALMPGAENLLCSVALLRHDETCVAKRAIESVIVGPGRSSWVECHGEGDVGCDLPVVQQPFNRDVHLVEGGVGVEKDDKFIFFEHIRD